MTEIVSIKRRALAANDEEADRLRREMAARGTLVVNLISSPGSGKTTLLEATIRLLGEGCTVAVVEGDVATERDAERIRALGVRAHQILTGGACHLDARQIVRALEQSELLPADILFIENVGNLICPTSYDLGEDFKVVVLSVTEGEDKPFKYPAIFSRAEVCVVSKADLLPHLRFDLNAVRNQVATLNPQGTLLVTSATSGEGLGAWRDVLLQRLAAKRAMGVDPAPR